MKRAIALILSLIMALSLVACGTPAAPDNANTSDSEENNDPYTIAVVVKITGIAWYERMQVGIDKFNADTGNDAYITGASTADAAEQVAVIEDLIAQGVDALVPRPWSPFWQRPESRASLSFATRVPMFRMPTTIWKPSTTRLMVSS